MRWLFIILCSVNVVLSSHAQEAEQKFAYDNYVKYSTQAAAVKNKEKEAAIKKFRKGFNEVPYRYAQLTNEMKKTGNECLLLLSNDGQFTDLAQQETKIANEKMLLSKYTAQSEVVAKVVTEAFNRLWKIADAYRKGEMKEQEVLVDKFYKAIIHYANMETGRNNAAPRFHASCFAIPTAAVNIYFGKIHSAVYIV
mgnify:FL=1